MRRFLSYFILVFLLISFGCAAPKSYYADVKERGNEEAMSLNASGVELASQGLHTQAIKEFRKAVAIDPFYADAYLNMSKSYYALNNYEFAVLNNIKYAEVLKQRDYSYKFNIEWFSEK